jgi:hypothetical protein
MVINISNKFNFFNSVLCEPFVSIVVYFLTQGALSIHKGHKDLNGAEYCLPTCFVFSLLTQPPYFPTAFSGLPRNALQVSSIEIAVTVTKLIKSNAGHTVSR